MRRRGNLRFYTVRATGVAPRVRALLLAAGAVGTLAGCSALSPASRTQAEVETTGSIRPVPTTRIATERLAPLPAAPEPMPIAAVATPAILSGTMPPPLVEREQATVRATLGQALLDQERAASVPWLDGDSGHGGMILPVGPLVRQGDSACRALIVSVQRGSETRWAQANACRDGSEGDWRLTDLRPFQNNS